MQEFDKKITQNLHVCKFCTTFAAFLKGFITKMAKVITPDGSKRRGKLDKQSNEVHRIGKNGEEQIYVLHPSSVPPTKAQNLYRKNFGKINAVVNSIVADPQQAQQWQERMNEHNRQAYLVVPRLKRYRTLRQYVFAMVREQLESKPSIRRRKAALSMTLPKEIKLQIKPFTDLTAAEVYEILKARCEVFLCEQRICYLDQDNIDYRATHFSLRRKGIVIAYARLFKDTEKGTYRVGRMLSKERGQGYGRYLMDQIISVARQLGAEKLSLHAQLPVVSFYEQFGYEAVGEAFQEAGMDHQKMVLTL